MSQRTLSGRITTSGRTLNNDVLDYATLSGSQTLTNKLLSTGCSYQGNPIDQQYLSLTGIVDLNTAQSLTNKSLGSGCSYTGNSISKTHLDNTLVDKDSSQTLTNKEIGSNSSYTGSRINIANLDESIVDKTTSQTVTNKTLQNSSLNHNSNQTTNIGTNTQQTYINGHLNVDTNTQRGIVRYINDDNHSIFLRRAVDGTDNTMSFYEFGTIDFYCGNGSNIQFNNMPRRLRISNAGTNFFTNTISIENSESGSNATGYAQVLFTNNNQPSNNFCALRLTGVNDNSNDKFINFYSDQISGGTDFYTMNLSTGQHDFTSKTAINLVIGSGSSYTGGDIDKTYLDDTLVDTNSTQSLTNKTIGSGSSYTGSAISKTYLDTSLVDLNSSETLTNKTLGTGCSIPYAQVTGTPTTADFFELIPNETVHIREKSPIESLTMTKFVGNLTGNITGNISSEGSVVITGNTSIDLKKSDNTPVGVRFYEGANYTEVKANSTLNSNNTLTLPTGTGTLARQEDLNGVTNPLEIVSGNIRIKGLTTLGTAGQIIKINSGGTGFEYGASSSITANLPLSITNNVLSLGGLTAFGGVGTVIGVDGNGTGLTYYARTSNSDIEQVIQNSITISTAGLFNNPATVIGNSARNITMNCSGLSVDGPSFINLKMGTDTRIGISNTNTTIKNTTVSLADENGTIRFSITNSINISLNKLLISSVNSTMEANAQFQVDTNAATKMVLKTTATNQDVELAMINGNQSGFIKYLASDNSLNFNNFQRYIFRIGAGTEVLNISSTRIRHPIETETNKQMYFYKIDNTAFDNANFRGKIFPGNDGDFALISNNVHLRLHAGEVVGQVGTINGNNVSIQFYVNGSERAYMNKTLFIVNNFFQVNYNNFNSFTQFTSNVPNAKVGFHFYQGTNNFQLYLDFSSSTLVSTCNRFQINSTTPSITDSAGRGLIFKTTTGNFVGVQVGNAVDKLSLNFGSTGSVFVDSNGNLYSETFTSHSWKTGVGNLVFQSDRNLVIYDSNNSAIFASNTSTSDRDKKENIVELEQNESIDIVKQLKTYRYNYKDDDEKTPQIGFMADETKPLIPECVKTISNGDKVSNLLFKENIVPHLVNTIQYCLNKIESLEKQVELLKSQ